MRQYRVSFFKNILSSDGHPFKCLQRSIDVVEKTEKRAFDKARSQFESDTHGPWMSHADVYEVEECGSEREKSRRHLFQTAL